VGQGWAFEAEGLTLELKQYSLLRWSLLIGIVRGRLGAFQPRRWKFFGLRAEEGKRKKMVEKNAAYWIERLQLKPHPEGGYFRQTYEADLTLPEKALPAGFESARRASTAIYFLLEGNNFSALHRLRSDEVWHFYAGAPIAVHVIDPAGIYSAIRLGGDPDAGEVFQAVVPAGCWFGSHIAEWKSFALVGCTVAPGFDFVDFEMAKREEMLRTYPQHRETIEQLTRH
jgi:predicted cupin superfamily sugar epimerase